MLALFLEALPIPIPIPGVSAQTTLQGNDCTAAGAYTLCQNLWGAGESVLCALRNRCETTGTSRE